MMLVSTSSRGLSLANLYLMPEAKKISKDVLLSRRLTDSAYILNQLVEITPKKLGGVPVLTGTRLKIAQILGEIADGSSIAKIARDFDLDREKLANLLRGIAIQFDRSFLR